jgi:hypothetical protein
MVGFEKSWRRRGVNLGLQLIPARVWGFPGLGDLTSRRMDWKVRCGAWQRYYVMSLSEVWRRIITHFHMESSGPPCPRSGCVKAHGMQYSINRGHSELFSQGTRLRGKSSPHRRHLTTALSFSTIPGREKKKTRSLLHGIRARPSYRKNPYYYVRTDSLAQLPNSAGGRF